MEFCPTCANMLLYELPYMDRSARLFCPTCPYVCPIENKVKIKRKMRLAKKPIDPVIFDTETNPNITKGVACPMCLHGEASFTQEQTRSADEPMTIIYTCTACRHTWRDE